MGKLTMQPNCGFVVGTSGLFLRVKRAEVITHMVRLNIGGPTRPIARHAFIGRFASLMRWGVHDVLTRIRNSEVRPAIVKFVARDMVNNPLRKVEDKPMQINQPAIRRLPLGISTGHGVVPNTLSSPWSILRINDCHFAARQIHNRRTISTDGDGFVPSEFVIAVGRAIFRFTAISLEGSVAMCAKFAESGIFGAHMNCLSCAAPRGITSTAGAFRASIIPPTTERIAD